MSRRVLRITPVSVMSGSASEKFDTSDDEAGDRDRDDADVEAELASGEVERGASEVGPAGSWLIRVATNAAEDAVDEEVAAMPSSITATADGSAPSPHVLGSTGPSTEGVAAQPTAGSTT